MTVPPFIPDRPIALIGLMGAGKTSIGKRLAVAMGLRFVDADAEIERAAGRTVSDIFAELGEAAFRDGERRVIARLLADPPHVLATGGGAFAQADTRELLRAQALVVWLRADVQVLAQRVARRATRPLLVGKDPVEVLTRMAHERYPAYAQAHLTVDAGDGAHAATVQLIHAALARHAGVAA